MLTIRNLTPTELKLKRIELHDERPGNISGILYIARNFFNSTSMSSENVRSFNFKGDIRIDAFKTQKTDIRMTQGLLDRVIRLIAEIDGQIQTIDTPLPKHRSKELVSSRQNSGQRYGGIFLENSCLLSVYSSPNRQSWMQSLNDSTPLSALSIPGTHNSPACFRALPSVRCQAVCPRVQLENGVRFLDVRVRPESPGDPNKGGLIMVHGDFAISFTGHKYFHDLVRTVCEFLDRNPSETVIISLKREGSGRHTDQRLSRILRDHYAGDVIKWYTEPRIPLLGECRGKIVLMRRFTLDHRLISEWSGRGWGIDAAHWRHNTPNEHRGDVCVQDFCNILGIEQVHKKIQYVQEHLERASTRPSIIVRQHDAAPCGPLYLNFLSASNFWKVGCWSEKIAAKVNPAIMEYLCEKHGVEELGEWPTGILICDWLGKDGHWDLVKYIVGMNSRVEFKDGQCNVTVEFVEE